MKSLLLFVVLSSSAHAWTTAPPLPTALSGACRSATRQPLSSSAASAETDELWFQAVEEASSSLECDIDECDKLATQLEEFIGCQYEEEEQDCDKEIQDRLDVAEILRLKIELQLRKDYLKNANLFAEDVIKKHDASERKKFKDALLANREKAPPGSDLGLW